MHVKVGWLTFLLTFSFAVSLFISIISSAWLNVSDTGGIAGFFGFGIPMLITGGATGVAWQKQQCLRILGWTSSIFSSIFGICLLILVGQWVATGKIVPNFLYFIGFGVPMLTFGAVGLGILFDES